jgi:hypothetical protein
MDFKSMVQGIVRHTLTTAGGYLVANGLATTDDTTAMVGGAVALVGVIWSLVAKRIAA